MSEGVGRFPLTSFHPLLILRATLAVISLLVKCISHLSAVELKIANMPLFLPTLPYDIPVRLV